MAVSVARLELPDDLAANLAKEVLLEIPVPQEPCLSARNVPQVKKQVMDMADRFREGKVTTNFSMSHGEHVWWNLFEDLIMKLVSIFRKTEVAAIRLSTVCLQLATTTSVIYGGTAHSLAAT